MIMSSWREAWVCSFSCYEQHPLKVSVHIPADFSLCARRMHCIRPNMTFMLLLSVIEDLFIKCFSCNTEIFLHLFYIFWFSRNQSQSGPFKVCARNDWYCRVSGTQSLLRLSPNNTQDLSWTLAVPHCFSWLQKTQSQNRKTAAVESKTQTLLTC